MIVLGPVPCQGCRQPVYWAGQGRFSFGWRDPKTGFYHECSGYNTGVGSSDEPNRIANDARVSATTRGAGVVPHEVVAR
jgi:tRNA(Arg) A34 adenosine deaminase TadA